MDITVIKFIPISTWNPQFVECIRRHYTGSRGAPVGKKMAWLIEEGSGKNTREIGFIGLGEPSYKLAPRRRLGLDDARPLPFTVSNFIFRLEGERSVKASRILKMWHEAASIGWAIRYGWVPIHWETMVGQGDPSNPGACFKRAGYRFLGYTTGRTARRPAGNTHGPRIWADSTPKAVFYKGPLSRLEV